MSRTQLAELGYSDAAVVRAVQAGRLYRLFHAAYAVGHPNVPRQGRCRAAVLACGEEALLSHYSAAWLLGLTGGFPKAPHVTTPWRGHRRRGIRVHHSTILTEEDRAVEEGIPTTALPRTLLDVAATWSLRPLEGLLEKAERMEALDLGALEAMLARAGGHKGRRRLDEALHLYRDPMFSRARSERLLKALVRKMGLPRPRINAFVGKYELDAYWEDERFAVEIDGWGTHRTKAAFERDPLRIEELKLSGIDAIRVTARRLEREPEQVGRRIRTFLDRRRAELAATGSPGGGRDSIANADGNATAI